MKIGIVGAGNAGKLFLISLLEIEDIKVNGIMDLNPNAPGMLVARKKNIPTFTDLEEFLTNSFDIIMELTGNDKVIKNILSKKSDNTHVIDSQAAKLTFKLTEHQQHLNKTLKDYIFHIQNLLQQMTKNIDKINHSVNELDNTSDKIQSSVSNTMNSIEKTDKIISIIEDVTNKVKILGINASIEAARAGEYGSGFTVVAREIERLASSTKSATSDIETMIDIIKNDIDGLSNVAEKLNSVRQEQTEISQSIEKDSNKVAAFIEQK